MTAWDYIGWLIIVLVTIYALVLLIESLFKKK